ncbi:hypothetical protein CBS101457_001674 [Exobasidium rhododendri]|nr:hypothetical protein CBS101457_001674 [Exobasidium rhododendri]
MVTFGSDAAPDELHWLESLPHHAIFTPQAGGQGRQCMAVRNSDLLVANGKTLRTMSLLEAKHNRHVLSSSTSSSSANPYKELVSDALDFEIAEIILNPSGRLLAVVGSHKVVILVLPRPGVYSSKSVGRQISVKAAAVGSYYYHERIGGRARIASVKWHPWGHLGSSLLIMSKDGVLREFDVSSDVEEPAQTVSLLNTTLKQVEPTSGRSKSRSRSKSYQSRSHSQTPMVNRSVRSTSRFALDVDDGENSEEDYMDNETAPLKNRSVGVTQAVTFTLGIDGRVSEDQQGEKSASSTDWNALTVYTLCRNGDIYALCPFMPKNASIPLSFINELSSLVTQQSPSSTTRLAQNDRDLKSRYVASLLKQARSSARKSSASPTDSRRSLSAAQTSGDQAGSIDDEMEGEMILLHAPPSTMVPQQPRPQGPFLLSPAPIELSEDRENDSTDLFFASIKTVEADLNILGVLGDDGRVDLCLLLDVMEPAWVEGQGRVSNSRKVSSSGRYALSDSESDQEDDGNYAVDTRSLPTLFVYETIDLGFGLNATNGLPPRFVLDPLYPDSFYIQHVKGAHALSMTKWSKKLLVAMSLSGEERLPAMERVLHKGFPSDVVQVVESSALEEGDGNGVIGLSIVSDVYLSYSFLALTQSGALVALELGLRVDMDGPADTFDTSRTIRASETELAAGAPAYVSLLGDGPPFTPPEPFHLLNGLPYYPRKAIKENYSRGELRVTTDTLRALATVVSTLRGEMRKIVQGGNVVQLRLELQGKELHRQLGKLNECKLRSEGGRQRQARLDARMKKVVDQQSQLAKRSDHLLQRLVESHSPEVSMYEVQWFKELQRLKEDVGKKDIDEESGLSARVAKLQYQLDTLRPALEEMKESRAANEKAEHLGVKQLQGIRSILAKEAQVLAEDRDLIAHLQSRMQKHTVY